MNRLKVGIIGLGGAGRAHAARFLRNKHVGEVRGYDPKKVDDLRPWRYGFSDLKVFSAFDKFASELDAVSICTPDYTHYEYIIKCLALGKHVLVEKPMVSSFQEASDLRQHLAKYPNLKFAVHHQMRCVPAFHKARELIQNRVLGDIFYVEANYWHDMRERVVKYDDWRVKGKGQSLIFGGLCHPLDLVLRLFDGDNEVVSHRTYISKNAFKTHISYTSATTMFQFRNNVVAKIHVNSSASFPQLNDLIVLGDTGSYIDGILFKDGRFRKVSNFDCEHRHQRRNLAASIVRWIGGAMNARIAGGVVSALCKHPLFRKNPFSVYNHSHACQLVVDNFVGSIISNEQVLVGYEQASKVIKLCEEFERDALLGSRFRETPLPSVVELKCGPGRDLKDRVVASVNLRSLSQFSRDS